jgi:hypothetical protein
MPLVDTTRKRRLAEEMRQRATDLPERLAAFVRRDAALLDLEADAIERRARVARGLALGLGDRA